MRRTEWSHFVERGRRWLRDASDDALAGGRDIADESERWFLGAVRSLGEGAERAQRGVDAVAHALYVQLARARPDWARHRTPRERLEHLLRREAARMGFDVSQERFAAFSEKIASLLELVYTGSLRLEDIAFENADDTGARTTSASKGVPSPAALAEAEVTPAGSHEAAEEVPDREQTEEREEREALRVEQDPTG